MKKTISYIILLLLVMLIPRQAEAVTKANADAEYQRGNYQQAVKDYEELLKQGVSADLYYNLGNAYYRLDNVTKAVLNYERAHLLSPGDADIKFNLEFARSKTIDKLDPEDEMFFVTWYRSLVNLMSVDGWAHTAVVCMIAALMLVLLYLFSSRIWMRKVGFFGGGLLILLFLASNIFAWQQKQALVNRTGAIVMSSSVSVKNTPSNSSNEVFVLHEGTRVDIEDKTMSNWRQIKLSDGREGWVHTKQIEEI